MLELRFLCLIISRDEIIQTMFQNSFAKISCKTFPNKRNLYPIISQKNFLQGINLIFSTKVESFKYIIR